MNVPSAPALLAARRLWARDGTAPRTATELAEDAHRVTGEVRRRLVRWIGSEGYQLLLQRALAQARTGYPVLAGVTCDGGELRGLPETMQAHEVPEVADGIEALFATLIDRLGRVVGPELAERLVAPAPETEGARDG